MALRDIVLYPHEVLATEATQVEGVDADIKALVDDMIQTMYDAPGIGLAAPQVGVLKRLTVIDVAGEEEEPNLHVFINPKIVHAEGRIIWQEGCLSIPGVYEKVERAERVVVQALDAGGAEFEVEADGLFAVAIQHEIDHLDGVVFLDHLSGLKRRMALKKYRKHLAQLEQKREAAAREAAEQEDG